MSCPASFRKDNPPVVLRRLRDERPAALAATYRRQPHQTLMTHIWSVNAALDVERSALNRQGS